MRKVLKYFPLAIVGLALLILFYFPFDAENIKEKQKLVDVELNAIIFPADAARVSHLTAHRPTTAIAQVTINGGRIASYVDLVNYFDDQVKEKGWKYLSEEKVEDWWRDYGGMSRIYCKNGMQLDLQYAGRNGDFGWTYAIAIVWKGEGYCK